MVDINKNPPWFRTFSRCKYSSLPVSHPALYMSQHPGTNYFVDIAKLGDHIVLIKGSGNARSYEMAEALRFIDEYVSKYFDLETGVFTIENYGDIGRIDFKARKLYIDHHKNSDFFWRGIFYKMSLIMRISFKIAQRLHIRANEVYAVDSFKQAIFLAEEIISQRDAAHVLNNDFEIKYLSEKNPESSKNVFYRLQRKFHDFKGKLVNQLIGFFTRHYSEAILQYIESIDWRNDGIEAPVKSQISNKSIKKVFDAISFIKSEIDDLLRQRDATEHVLRESEARHRQLVEHAKAGILEFDYQANKTISVNDSFLNISGYSKEEICSMNLLDIMTEESRKKYLECFSQHLSGKRMSPDTSYQFITKSGHRKWILLNSHTTVKDGQPLKADIVLTEITHLKRIESELLDYQSKLKQLSIQLSKAEENQRRQLASQLHESVSQELFVAQLKINALDKSIDDPQHSSQLDVIREQIVKSIKEIKGITYDLSPPVLYDLGLKEAVDALSKSIESKYHLPVKPRFSGSLEHIDDEVKIIIFRVIKELIHNSIKHASADFISIIIESTRDNLNIDVSDNGVGFDAGSLSEGHFAGDGFGLFDIREKINHLGGRVRINSVPGSGTRIGLNVPLNEPAYPPLRN